MLAFMFPGQGSQFVGMGENLFEKYPQMVSMANDFLGYSIEDLCLRDEKGLLNNTAYTQPALYVVNALSYHDYIDHRKGDEPDCVLGHSLGEYNALYAAGCMSFLDGLSLVKKRGEIMSHVKDGGMAAVINCSAEVIKRLLKENQLNNIDIANYNSPSQTVISGNVDEINRAQPIFEKNDAYYVPLNVSGAFHSRYMEGAANEYAIALSRVHFNTPKIPVISNLNASLYVPKEIQLCLKKQIFNSVLWSESVEYALDRGVSEFVEIGPGNVLEKLVAAIKRSYTPRTDIKKGFSIPDVVKPLENKPDNISTAPIFTAENLGSSNFRKAYNVKYAYVAGAMYKAIASKEMVVKLGNSGLMGFYGAGGVSSEKLEKDIQYIKDHLKVSGQYGINLIANLQDENAEMRTVDMLLKHGVNKIEAAAFIRMSEALVRYRLTGLKENVDGTAYCTNRILAKISRPEVAEAFLSPAPKAIVDALLEKGLITPQQAKLASLVPMADDICVEADSGGHTDRGNLCILFPAIKKMAHNYAEKFGYRQPIQVGAAGGIGSPESAASAFMLGADFILTGSINQCTVEADISDVAKDMLAQMSVHDTDYAPAGDMFEFGSKIQVLKKGVFFPGRANKLYELWKNHQSWEEIDVKTRQQIEENYFSRSFDKVYEETKNYYNTTNPSEIIKAEGSPKYKMSLVFRWYFIHSSRLAREGDVSQKTNFQIHTGGALGAFNEWVAGSELADWRNRHVNVVGEKLIHATANQLNTAFSGMMAK